MWGILGSMHKNMSCHVYEGKYNFQFKQNKVIMETNKKVIIIHWKHPNRLEQIDGHIFHCQFSFSHRKLEMDVQTQAPKLGNTLLSTKGRS